MQLQLRLTLPLRGTAHKLRLWVPFAATAAPHVKRWASFLGVQMRLEGYGRSWLIEDEASLERALAYRDSRGGAQFWFSPNNADFPCLALRISGEVGDIHYFPEEGHPGFRRLGGKGLLQGGVTVLVFEGCDPGDGEESPNVFIVPSKEIIGVAKRFLYMKNIVDLEAWEEL